MWSRTREEDLAVRTGRRRALGIVGVLLAFFGLCAVGLGVILVPTDGPPVSMVLGLVSLVAAVACGVLRSRIPRAPDLALPHESQLPLHDPRSFRTLAERRQLWLLGISTWGVGWVVGGAGAWALSREGEHGLALVVFLGSTWSTVAIGSLLMRRWTGSTSWPR